MATLKINWTAVLLFVFAMLWLAAIFFPFVVLWHLIKRWNRCVRQNWYNPFENDVFRSKFEPPIDVIDDPIQIKKILDSF